MENVQSQVKLLSVNLQQRTSLKMPSIEKLEIKAVTVPGFILQKLPSANSRGYAVKGTYLQAR